MRMHTHTHTHTLSCTHTHTLTHTHISTHIFGEGGQVNEGHDSPLYAYMASGSSFEQLIFLLVRISKLFNHISHFQAKIQNAENIPRKHYLDSF